MLKYLLLALLVVWLLYSPAVRGYLSKPRAAKHAKPPRPRTEPAVQAMVRCAHCGTHLPAADAIQDGEMHYCSQPHRQAGPARS